MIWLQDIESKWQQDDTRHSRAQDSVGTWWAQELALLDHAGLILFMSLRFSNYVYFGQQFVLLKACLWDSVLVHCVCSWALLDPTVHRSQAGLSSSAQPWAERLPTMGQFHSSIGLGAYQLACHPSIEVNNYCRVCSSIWVEHLN